MKVKDKGELEVTFSMVISGGYSTMTSNDAEAGSPIPLSAVHM